MQRPACDRGDTRGAKPRHRRQGAFSPDGQWIVFQSDRWIGSLGLIRPVHVRGDRKQYYETKDNPWEAFRIILDDHKRRVIDPAVDLFHSCLAEQEYSAPEDTYTLDRMRNVVSFFDATMPLYEQLRRLPNGSIQSLLKVTATIKDVLE